jgi:hypothetical protein
MVAQTSGAAGAYLLDQYGRPFRSDGSARPNGMALPHGWQFVAKTSGAFQTYWMERFDEALRKSREDANVMRRDPWLRSLLQERITAVQNLPWHLEVPDESDPAQVACKDGMTRIVKAVPGFRRILGWLLEATWYGRFGVQFEWAWGKVRDRQVGTRKALTVAQSWPVNGDKIGYRYDHTPTVQIYAPEGEALKAYGNAEVITTTNGRAIVLSGTWRERFVIHKYMMEDRDYYSPEEAGAVHGVGVRDVLFWMDWMKKEWMGSICDFFSRVGLGVTMWKYPAGNAAALAAMKQAARDQSDRAHIFIPVTPEDAANHVTGMERVEIPVAGAESLTELVKYLDHVMERYVVGQEGSASATGAGGHSSGESAGFMRSCVPLDSEILTRDGFKSPYDVRVGEEVLAYDVDAGVCRWTPLVDKSFYHDAPVSRLHSTGYWRRFEAFCTPDHSWVMERTDYPDRRPGRPQIPESECVTGSRGGLKVKKVRRSLVKADRLRKGSTLVLAAPEEGTVESLLTPEEAALLGWAVTDGTIQYRGGSVVLGICQSKERNFPGIRKLIHAFNPEAREHVSKPTVRTFPTGKTYACKPEHWWYVPSRVAKDLLTKAGFTSRGDLPRIATRLSPEARRAMLDAMMTAEGTEEGAFLNTDPRVVEAFEILCALEGIALGKTARDGVCSIKRTKKVTRVSIHHLCLEDAGRAAVWCPTTRYGTWVMRQRGRVMITGNTKRNIILLDASLLSETLTGLPNDPGVLNVIQRWTYPDTDFPVNFAFDVESEESEKKLQAIKQLVVDMRVPVKADDARRAAGVSKPVEGDELIEPPQTPGSAPMGGSDPAAALQGLAPGGVGAEGHWVRQPGPRSNRRWVNTETGDVKYSDQPMTAGAPGSPAVPKGSFLDMAQEARAGEPSRYEAPPPRAAAPSAAAPTPSGAAPLDDDARAFAMRAAMLLLSARKDSPPRDPPKTRRVVYDGEGRISAVVEE